MEPLSFKNILIHQNKYVNALFPNMRYEGMVFSKFMVKMPEI